MYIPQYFRFNHRDEMVAFMKQYSFATIVTQKDQVPVATQLPFVVDDSTGKLVLKAHFAAANEQAKYIAQNTSLVIFAEPHAYISPVDYDKKESVPTWNYIAVHAYGKATILTDEMAVGKAMEQMIMQYEPGYLAQWNGLSDKYKTGMMKGVVAFEIEVTDLQGQKKVSQNKSAGERERISGRLENSGDALAAAIAREMRGW
ncbi:MAG: FMN-binding negative transcriptional regulator [Chitinophaga sp.]|uniref:FMN-binding negative transcriptional regulator n=1 Tax=Chitinophaga sp. TaxID=1869181 RepID=UPI001B19CF39|nr:FMN-binding negative transcriptional regulator [Chitinophaga sp.]MBO9730325.1 FMN-binding negative transcriptional regulator [Chitinophaga sp.]